LVTSTNGLQTAGWSPNSTTGDVYTRVSHWAGRPVFLSEENGWGEAVYMYWFPGNVWPAELEVGWYISATLGSDEPLAYLPERIPVPTSHTVSWRFQSGTDGAWRSETTVMATCKKGLNTLTHDYHGSVANLADTSWYGDSTCLLYSKELDKCISEIPA
jgi:hypothetical protein